MTTRPRDRTVMPPSGCWLFVVGRGRPAVWRPGSAWAFRGWRNAGRDLGSRHGLAAVPGRDQPEKHEPDPPGHRSPEWRVGAVLGPGDARRRIAHGGAQVGPAALDHAHGAGRRR